MKKFYKILLLILLSFLTVFLILYSSEIKKFIINSISVCIFNVIPLLFPTYCICLSIINCSYISLLPKKLAPFFLFLLAMIAGYPVGAKILNTMVANKQLSNKDAERILPALICAGPSFIISMVGVQIYDSINIGLRLYIAQILSNLIIFLFFKGYSVKINLTEEKTSFIKSFTVSVKQSSNAILTICSYVIFFTAICELFNLILGKNLSRILCLFFEITSAVYNSNNVYLTCALLSFSGFCVILQIYSMSHNIKIKILQIIKIRIISALISCCVLKLSFKLFPSAATVISNIEKAPSIRTVSTIPFFIVLIFSTTVLLFSINIKSTGKILKDLTL